MRLYDCEGVSQHIHSELHRQPVPGVQPNDPWEKEEDIINRLAKVIEQIIGHEQAARETLLEKKRTMLIDQVGRAYGILRNAAHLQKNSQQKLSAEKRDALRADIVRAKLRTFPMPNMFQAPAEPGGNGNGDAN